MPVSNDNQKQIAIRPVAQKFSSRVVGQRVMKSIIRCQSIEHKAQTKEYDSEDVF